MLFGQWWLLGLASISFVASVSSLPPSFTFILKPSWPEWPSLHPQTQLTQMAQFLNYFIYIYIEEN